jgi:hypothetical protein
MSSASGVLGSLWHLRVLAVPGLLLVIGGICSAAVTLPLAAKARRDDQELGLEGDPTKWRRPLSLGALGGVLFLVGVALLVTSLALAVWSQALSG